MKIKATIERIPGGMMLIPLLLGAVLNTLAPDTGAYFGSFTNRFWQCGFFVSAHLLICGQPVRYYASPVRW